jgi:hypothetical protein
VLFVTADSASMISRAVARARRPTSSNRPRRLDVGRLWRRGLFRQIRRLNEHLSARGLHRASEWLDAAQDWLHARRILRYPRDLRRIQDAVYALQLARPASAFDPGALPARKAAVDLTALSGLHEVAQRCRVLHGWISRRAAE